MNNEGRPVDGLRPGEPLRGSCRPPASKSILQRALVAAACARGTTRFRRLATGQDVQAARRFAALIASVRAEGSAGDVLVEGRRPAERRGRTVVDVGESGTLARIATAVLGLCIPTAGAHGIQCSGTLERRRSDALVAALRAAGGQLESFGEGTWPLEIRALADWDRVVLRGPRSSQEVTALLLAGAALGGERAFTVEGAVPSLPYVGLTAAVLEQFGVRVETPDAPDGAGTYRVVGDLLAPGDGLTVEPDASAAAVALAAGCLTDGRVVVPDLGAASRQGDVAIVEHLGAFGCAARASEDRLSGAGRPTNPAVIDLGGEPDLAPVLAVVAAAVALADPTSSPSRLEGLETLQGKESPRVRVLVEGLRAVGLAAEGADTHLTVAPRARRSDASQSRPVRLDAHGDHRMAFAFALLGLVREGVTVVGSDAVAKSWPDFWTDLSRLGARRAG